MSSKMTAQQYLDSYRGQSLLYAPSPQRESLRGQCVQSVCFFVTANNAPVLWVEGAKDWWDAAASHPEYERIVNTPEAVPQPGDIIIWNSALPGSGGYGHIDVCLQAFPGTGTFAGVDQNWGGKTVHQVTHNYSYVIGWLRIRTGGMGGGAASAATPAPAAAPQTQGDEMIANETQAHEAYQLLRPNGDGSADEIAATAGKRTWAEFSTNAQNEVAARNRNLQDQAQHLSDMQGIINSTNATVTDLRSTINNDQVSNAQKQMALDTALAQIAKDNSDMIALHDQVTDLQAKIADPLASASAALNGAANMAKRKAGKSGGLLVAFIKFFMSLQVSKIFPKLKKS